MKKLSAFFVMLILMITAGVCVHAADFDVQSSILPLAHAYEEYNGQIKMSGEDNEGYTFEFVSGIMPAGLTLHSDGSINGIPTAYGTYSMINVRITHTDGESRVVEFTMIIMPMKVKVEVAAPAGLSYDGQPHTADVKCYDMDGTLLEDLVPDVTYGRQKLRAAINAGQYYINISLPSGYMIAEYVGDERLIINTLTAEISAEGKTVPYDGQPHGITDADVTVNPAEAGYVVQYRKEGESVYTSNPPVASGRYEARVQSKNSNYETVYTTVTINILAQGISFTMDKTSAEYNGGPQGVIATPSEEVGFTLSYTDAQGNPVTDEEGNPCQPTNAGTYKIIITFDNADAYSIESMSSDTFTITPKRLKFTFKNKEINFTGMEQTPEYTLEPAELESYTVTYRKQGSEQELTSIKDAGVYDVIVNLGNNNYTLTEDSDKTIEIVGTEVTFIVSNNEYFYSGNPCIPDIASEPEISAEDYAIVYTNSKGETVENPIDADTYTISIEMKNPGYTVGTITPNELIIKPQTVNFEVKDNNNSFPYDGQIHKIEMNSTPEISAEDYAIVYTNSKGETVENPINADTYTISVEMKNSGYTAGTITPNEMVITPQVVTFNVSNNNIPCDGKTHTATITTESSIPQESYTVEYADSEGNRTNNVKNVGEYQIVITITDGNYILSDEFSAVMTITSASILNLGNSPAAMIYKDSAHADDTEWQEAALEYLRENRRFSVDYLPEGCRADIEYQLINILNEDSSSVYDFELDKNTVITKSLKTFNDPGILLDGNIFYGSEPTAVNGVENLYEVFYTGETTDVILGSRYVAVVNRIGDANGDKIVNAIDANYLDNKNSEPYGIAEARVWDVNKDGMLDKNDAAAIRNRFRNPLVSYYPWLEN